MDEDGVVLEVRARPGSSREEVLHDPWRKVWTVAVREPALDGRANRAILELLARVLKLAPAQVVWESAGRSRSKRVRVFGLRPEEVERRLREAQTASSSSSAGPAKR